MRFGSIIGEALRDVRSGTTRALLLALVFGLLLMLGVAVAVSDSRAAVAAAREYRSSGASITVLRADGRVDGATCDAFADLPGVRASGAVRAADVDLVPAVLPSSPVPTKVVTPGFPAVLAIDDAHRRGGVLLSADAVATIGLTGSSEFATRQGSATIAGVFAYPDDGRQGDLGYSALISHVRGDVVPYDECWVDVWPESPQIVGLLRTAAIPGSDDRDPPTTRQLNSRLGSRFAGADSINAGLSRFAAAGSAVTGLALGAVSVARRRLELASARHAGVTRSAQTAGQFVQSLAWLGAGVVLASPVLLTLSRDPDPATAGALLVTGLTTTAATVLAATAGVVAATLAVRETHLFRYFKDR